MIGGWEICLIIIIGLIYSIVHYCTIDNGERSKIVNRVTGLLVTTVVVTLVLYVLPKSVSYYSALEANGYHVQMEQRVTALKLYVKHANRPTGVMGGHVVSDLTDHKYENYQRYLNDCIHEISWMVREYNDIIVTKKLMKECFMWQGLIVLPPTNLKVIELRSLIPIELNIE